MVVIKACELQVGNVLMLRDGNGPPLGRQVVRVEEVHGEPRRVHSSMVVRVPWIESTVLKDGSVVPHERHFYKKVWTVVEIENPPKLAVTFLTGGFSKTGKAKACVHRLPLELPVVVM